MTLGFNSFRSDLIASSFSGSRVLPISCFDKAKRKTMIWKQWKHRNVEFLNKKGPAEKNRKMKKKINNLSVGSTFLFSVPRSVFSWVNQKEILDINEHDEISTLESIWCRIWLYTIRIKVNDDDASQ